MYANKTSTVIKLIDINIFWSILASGPISNCYLVLVWAGSLWILVSTRHPTKLAILFFSRSFSKAFYGTNLNQALILSSMGFAPEDLAPWDTLFKQALGNLILSVLGALPGYIVSVLLIEKIGRKPIQFLGFILVGIIFIILGAAWGPIHQVSVALFIVLFAIAMVREVLMLIMAYNWLFCKFFFNFGPNTTTFVFPAEIFPTRHRAKAHGISAASGKLGAIIATFAFNSLADVGGQPGERHFLPSVLIIFGALMLLCIIFTTWMPEPKVFRWRNHTETEQV